MDDYAYYYQGELSDANRGLERTRTICVRAAALLDDALTALESGADPQDLLTALREARQVLATA